MSLSLVTGDIYSFRIIARNVVGDSIASTVLTAMAATLPSTPGTPTCLKSSESSITI